MIGVCAKNKASVNSNKYEKLITHQDIKDVLQKFVAPVVDLPSFPTGSNLITSLYLFAAVSLPGTFVLDNELKLSVLKVSKRIQK